MPTDIFDEVESGSKGDIFDEIATPPSQPTGLSHRRGAAPLPTVEQFAISSIPSPAKQVRSLQPWYEHPSYPLTDVYQRPQDEIPTAEEAATRERESAKAPGLSIPHIVGGIEDLATGPSLLPTPGVTAGQTVESGLRNVRTPGKRFTGALQIAAGGLEPATGLIGPAAVENPVNIAKGFAEGYAASQGAGYGAKKLGADPEQQELIKTLAFWAPGVVRSVIDPRIGVGITPEEVSVRAGINPPGVGPKTAEFRFSRGGKPAPEPTQPGIEPPTIEGQVIPPRPPGQPPAEADAAVAAMSQSLQHDAMAERVANGQPAVPPPPPQPAPPKVTEITAADVQRVGTILAKLPPEVRGPAIIEAHGTLAKMLLEQGKIVGPDGKLEVIDSEKTASRVAQKWINDEVTRQDEALAARSGEGVGKEGAAPEKPTSAAAAPKESPIVKTRTARNKLSSPPVPAPVPTPSTTSQNPPNEAESAPGVPSNLEIVGEEEPTGVESAGANVPVSVESNGTERPAVPSAGARQAEQLSSGIPGRPQGGNESERPEEKPAPTFKRGDEVTLPSGEKGTISFVHPNFSFVRGHLQKEVSGKELSRLPAQQQKEAKQIGPDRFAVRGKEFSIGKSKLQAANAESAVAPKPATEQVVGEVLPPAKKTGQQMIDGYGLKLHWDPLVKAYAVVRPDGGQILDPVSGYPQRLETKEEMLEWLGNNSERLAKTGGYMGKELESVKGLPATEPPAEVSKPRISDEAASIADTFVKSKEFTPWGKTPNAKGAALHNEVIRGLREATGDDDALFQQAIEEAEQRAAGATGEPAKTGKTPLTPIPSPEYEFRNTGPQQDIGEKVRASKPEPPRERRTRIRTPEEEETNALWKQARAELGDTKEKLANLTTEQVEKRVEELKAEKTKGQKYKFGNTQANIPAESEAAQSLNTARARISDSDLAGKGKDIGEGGNHVTVRYGIKGDDTEKIKAFLAAQKPFEATLGKTEKFPPSEHSDGAAVIVAPIESPELHRLNDEIQQHGEFAESSFKEYRPHATIAYVDPAKADRYTGMSVTAGKKFTVNEIAVSKKDGSQEIVKLEGKRSLEIRGSQTQGWSVYFAGTNIKAYTAGFSRKLAEDYIAEHTQQSPEEGTKYVLPSFVTKGLSTRPAETPQGSNLEQFKKAYFDELKSRVQGAPRVGFNWRDKSDAAIQNFVDKSVEEITKFGTVPNVGEALRAAAEKVGVKPNGKAITTYLRGTTASEETAKPQPGVLDSYTNKDEGMESRVTRGADGKYNVHLVDLDSGKVAGNYLGYDSLEKASARAKQLVGESKPVANQFSEGDRVTWTDSHGTKLTGKIESIDAARGTASIDVDQVRLIGGRIPIGRVETVKADLLSLEPQPGTKPALTKEPTMVGKEQEGEQPQSIIEGRRPVPAAESGRGAEPARVEPEAGKAVGEIEQSRAEAGQPSKPSSGDLAGRGETRPESGPGAGTGEPGTIPAVGENARGRGTRRAAGVTGTKRNADWFSHPEDFSVEAGNSTRLQWNVKALTILKKVLAGETKLTDEDRDALAHYVGWGALQHAFSPYSAPYGEQQKWIEANRKLQDLMTDDEYRQARASTMNAHFTSPQIVRFMWDAAKRLGFTGGTLLEPSMGSGNFFGMMPKAVRSKSQAVGNELDPTTFNIAKLLYPSATLFNKNFVDLSLPDNSIDFVIGNVPFGEEIFDPHYPKLKARIHDYFIVKSLDKVRPGGIAALITSTGTLDKPNERIRDVMRSKADLVFALRFPATTFEKTAGTHVTTDLLIFQKREVGAPEAGEPYNKVVKVTAPHEQEGGTAEDYLNEYYDKHPENLLGKLAISRRMYGSNDLVLLPDKETPFEDQLKAALDRIPKGLIDNFQSSPIFKADSLNLAPDTLVDGNLFLGPKGEIWQKQNGGTRINPFGELTQRETDRVTQLIKLRDALTDLYYSMKTVPNDDIGNSIVAQKQKSLLSAYKAYIDKHGLIRSSATSKLFSIDPYYARLAALEQFDRTTKKTTPAEIFTKRTILPRQELTVLSKDPKEALLQVLNERGRPDLDFMAKLSSRDVPELAEELGKQGLVYRDPVGGDYKMAEDYLSGYVRDKLADAEKAVAQGQKEFQRNVDALKKVVPPDKPIERIAVRPGATWIPREAIQEFVRRFMHSGDVRIANIGGNWAIDGAINSAENISQYGNEEFPGTDLLQMALNLRQPVSYDIVMEPGEDGKLRERRVVNQQRTIAARELQEKLSDHFSKWMKDHEEWAPQLVRIYNDTYNNLVAPQSDGSHLTFPGANMSVLRNNQFMPHQRDVIWRLIQNGSGLIAQVVGAGKTYSMIAAGAEFKRLGQFKKILYAVPNHLVDQWGRDWARLYPGANVLVIGKEDFSAKNRQIAMAKIANNDWDAIIMPHSHFNMMDISPERQRKTFEKDLDELEETIRGLSAQAKHSYGRASRAESRMQKRTVKQLEKAKANLQAKISQLASLKADKAINFDDTGIDSIFVDEAHEYKNLLFYTKMQRVAGLAQGNAKRATRLKMKTDYLLERNNGRGVIFATGTPIQNTMAEMYNMIRYVAPSVLEKAGIKYFDDWAANFGKVITAMELSADSQSYKPRAKFAEFTNVPELQMMFNSFADVRTNDDLPELKALLPKVEGGKPIIVEVENPEIAPIVKNLVMRAAAIRGDAVPVLDDAGKPVIEDYTDPKTGQTKKRPKMQQLPKPKPDEDNMLSVVTEGRLAATDPRLLNPKASGQFSKIHDVVKNVLKEYKDGQANKVTQLIFADRFRYTNRQTGKEEFNLYHAIRDELVKGGIPKSEIAIIHDYDSNEAKLGLFDDVNAGKIRVLMGSSAKMGAGMNVQKRLVANHHVDFPWKPGELEQRDGRLERQGNTNAVVRKYWYTTKESFDAYMGQTLSGKAKFIWQVLAGKDVGDTITDAASDAVLSYEEMKAIASGNPDVKRKMELESKIRKLEILSEQHDAQARERRGMIASEQNRIATFKAGKVAMEQALANYRAAVGPEGKNFSLEILGEKFDDVTKANEWLEKQATPISNLHIKLNGLPLVLEPQLKRTEDIKPTESQVKYLEYKVPYPITYRTTTGGVEGIEGLTNSSYTAPAPTLASAVRSATGVIRNLPEMISNVDGAIKYREQRTSRLKELAKEEKAFDDKELRASQKELRDVNSRLGIDEFQAALEQEVASDIDGSADEGDDAEPGDSIVSKLIHDESGAYQPGATLHAAARAARTIGEYIREEAKLNKISRDLHAGMYDLESEYSGRVLRAVQKMQEIAAQYGKQLPVDAAVVYDHLENPEAEPLTSQQDKLLDEVVLPIMEDTGNKFTELKQLMGTEDVALIENYVHRMAKGKNGWLDRIVHGFKKGTGRGNLLSKSAPQTKARTMMAIESPDGDERRVISIKGGKATMWVNGQPTELGEIRSAKAKSKERNETFPEGEDMSPWFAEGRIVEGPDGYDWKIVQATTKEIEANTSIEYYHNALASAFLSNLQVSKALRGAQFIEAFKKSPDFDSIAMKVGHGTPPQGWGLSQLPQMHDYYFEPHVREVLDWYANRIKGQDPNIFDKLNSFLRTSIFFNPLIHIPNISVHWAVEKGPSGYIPTTGMTRTYRTSVKAINAVIHQNQDFLDALDAGAPLVSHRNETSQLTKLFFDQLAEGLEKNQDWATKIAKTVGMAVPDLIKGIYWFSGKATWVTNDIAFLQASYEKVEQGMDLKTALMETAKHIPDYRLPVRMFNSAGLSKILTNPAITMFMAYHYGALKSYAEMAKSAFGVNEPPPGSGRSKAQEAAHGWELLIGVGLATFFLYPLIMDRIARAVTGDKNAKFRRAGAATFPYNAYMLATHQKSLGDVLQSVVTPAVGTKTAAELSVNRDFYTGRQIYDPLAPFKDQAQEIGRKLAEAVSPVGQGSRLMEGGERRKRALFGMVGISFPKTRAEKMASDIALRKIGTQPMDEDQRQGYYVRKRALDALRKGDSSELEKAENEGKIDREQAKRLKHRAILTPLQDTVNGFTYQEIMSVYNVADNNEKTELEPIIRRKRSNLMKRHRGEEVSDVENAQ